VDAKLQFHIAVREHSSAVRSMFVFGMVMVMRMLAPVVLAAN
jgi:hypothetical protein